MKKGWNDSDLAEYQKKVEEWLAPYTAIPLIMQEALVRYIVHGRPTGSFLAAVLSNDLIKAVARGDEENQRALHEYAKFLYNHAPTESFGSEEAFDKWKLNGGIRGLMMEKS